MFAHDGRASASDLSYWLGPLSASFTAMAGAPHAPLPEASGGFGTTAPRASSPEPALEPPAAPAPDLAELRTLFHTLNNQLGVILTYAELLEAKAPDEGLRARATQIVTAAIDALTTSKQIRTTVVK